MLVGEPLPLVRWTLAAGCLLGLAHADFKNAGIPVVATLMLFGLVLNMGLTASSVAIMNNTPAEKAGAAGALEATSYDLGSGLGITLFGIAISNTYAKHIIWPEGLTVAENAGNSIGETMSFAARLGSDWQPAVEQAARSAFGNAHGIVLTTAAAIIGILAVVVFFQLCHQTNDAGSAGDVKREKSTA